MIKPTIEMEKALALLKRQAQRLGLELEPEVLEKYGVYLDFLGQFNEHTNLVANADPDTVVQEHILDSLSLLLPIEAQLGIKSLRLVDVGSGAGFPALILAVARPDWQVTMVDSIGKKCRFLEEAVRQLGLLANVRVINERAEILAHEKSLRGNFDLATARAVATLDLSSELVLAFLHVGGYFFAQKSGAQVADEQKRAAKALPLLGGRLKQILSLDSEVLGKARVIMLVEKIARSQDAYPRPAAKIKQHPLA